MTPEHLSSIATTTPKTDTREYHFTACTTQVSFIGGQQGMETSFVRPFPGIWHGSRVPRDLVAWPYMRRLWIVDGMVDVVIRDVGGWSSGSKI